MFFSVFLPHGQFVRRVLRTQNSHTGTILCMRLFFRSDHFGGKIESLHKTLLWVILKKGIG